MHPEQLETEMMQALLDRSIEPQKALRLAERGIAWSSRSGWIGNLAIANLLAGDAHQRLKLYEPAVEHFQRASTLFQDGGNDRLMSQAQQGLGSVYLALGEYSLAIEHLRKALTRITRTAEQGTERRQARTRLLLCKALMNMAQWSDAEQELLLLDGINQGSDANQAEHQLLTLRLAFHRGDQRSIREQLKVTQNVVHDAGDTLQQLALEYYSARYIARYERVKRGEQELAKLWQQADQNDINVHYLVFEAASELLQSDYPKKGIEWLNRLLDIPLLTLALQQQIHRTLALFYLAHRSHELACEHFTKVDALTTAMRANEITHQWALYRADEAHLELRQQVDQQQRNNQILAESNALLQAVNRIALTVNSSPDANTLLRQLRQHLRGWIDIEVVALAAVHEEVLEFTCVLDGEKEIPFESVSLNDNRAWSVKAVNEGRIQFSNDFELNDEILMTDSSTLVRSVAFAPLKWEQRIIGVLSLQTRQPDAFNPRAISLLEYISPVISIAFVNLMNLDRAIELSGELNKQAKELHDVRKLMAHLSEHDEHTGLPNRSSLPIYFQRWLERAPFYALAVRIDNLDELSLKTGYGAEEEVVQVVAQRLRNRMRDEDMLLHAGKDQFLIFVETMPRDHLRALAEQLQELTSQPLRAKDETVTAQVSVGVVQYPDHGETLDEIMSMLTVAVSHAANDEPRVFIID